MEAKELDVVLGKLTLLPSRTFFDIDAKSIKPAEITPQLRRGGITVVWIRHHWVLAQFDPAGGDGTQHWRVYDSATSMCVRRDLEALAAKLGLEPPAFPACPQQLRESFECGIFVMVFALLLHRGEDIPSFTDKVSLAHLRRVYPDANALFVLGLKAFSTKAPTATQHTVEGGAPKRQHKGADPMYPQRLEETQGAGPKQVVLRRNDPYCVAPKVQLPMDPFLQPGQPSALDLDPDVVDMPVGEPEVVDMPPATATARRKEMRQRLALALRPHVEEARCPQIADILSARPDADSLLRDPVLLGAVADAAFFEIVRVEEGTEIGGNVGALRDAARQQVGVVRSEERIAVADATEGRAIHTSTLDTLLMHALAEYRLVAPDPLAGLKLEGVAALKGLRPISLVNRGGEPFSLVVRPLWYIDHYSLLIAEFDEEARLARCRVFDSIASYRVADRTAIVNRSLVGHALAPSFAGVEVVSVGPQAPNECGFRVLRSFLFFLGSGTSHAPWERSQVMPSIVENRRRLRVAAEKRLQELEEQFSKKPPPKVCPPTSVRPVPQKKLPSKQEAPVLSDAEEEALLVYRAHHNTLELPVLPVLPAIVTPKVRPMEPVLPESPTVVGYSEIVASRQRSLDAPALPLTHTRVRQILRGFSVGELVDVRWVMGSEHGRWVGPVRRSSRFAVGVDALVDYMVKQCPCGAWVPLEGYLNSYLPWSVVTYLSVVRCSAMPALAECDCPEILPVVVSKPAVVLPLPEGKPAVVPLMPEGKPAVVLPLPEGRTVSFGEIRALLRRCKRGAWWRVVLNTPDGVAWTVSGPISSDGEFTIRYEECADCGLLCEEEEPFSIMLPSPGYVYYEIDSVEKPLPDAEGCSCVEQEDVDVRATAEFAQFSKELLDDATSHWQGTEAAAPYQLTGDVGKSWFVFNDKPPHVHTMAWNRTKVATRRLHLGWIRSVQAMPADLRHAPLASAIVSLILRRGAEIVNGKPRWGSFATFASAMAQVASALRHLPLYANVAKPINIRECPAFEEAYRRALHLAKITKRHAPEETLSPGDYQRVLKILADPESRLLAESLWITTSRPNDLRQVVPADCIIHDKGREDGSTHFSTTLRHGKGASFNGPFTIRAIGSRDFIKRLRLHLREARPNENIFSCRAVAAVAAAVRVVSPGATIRAMRRGALQYLSSIGCTDEELMLLSGHASRGTLWRYLGWGLFSQSAKAAAESRYDRERGDNRQGEEKRIDGAGAVAPTNTDVPLMGKWSGYAGHKGQRTRAPPSCTPLKAPSSRDLGLEKAENTDSWPPNVKNVHTFEWDDVFTTLGHTERLDTAHEWATTAKHFGANDIVYAADDVPKSKFLPGDMDAMRDVEKIEPHVGPIRGFVKGWMLPQPKKRTRRPIFEPCINTTCDETPRLRYPSRRERRTMIARSRFTCDYDMAGYYDQFIIPVELRCYFVVRVGDALFHLTRMPMGAAWAPAVAQALTWALCDRMRLIYPDDIVSITMIDNIRIAADDPEVFVAANAAFRGLCAECGLQLNDLERPDGFAFDDEGDLSLFALTEDASRLLQFGLAANKTFLGELYVSLPGGPAVKNCPSHLEKMHRAVSRFDVPGESHTCRTVCSALSLGVWLADTVDIHIRTVFPLQRAFCGLGKHAALHGWDSPLPYVSPVIVRGLRALDSTLQRNTPVLLKDFCLGTDAHCTAGFDAVLTIDASASGWGAYVQFVDSGRVIMISQRWASGCFSASGSSTQLDFDHSATAEPTAVVYAVRWLTNFCREQKIYIGNLAIVTDHEPIVTAQRRTWSGNGGYGHGWPLNECFLAAYAQPYRVQFFWIAGHLNPADGPSRTATTKDVVVRESAGVILPDVGTLWFPYPGSGREVCCA